MREEEEVEEVVVGEGEWGVGEAVGQGAVEGAHTMVVGAGDEIGFSNFLSFL